MPGGVVVVAVEHIVALAAVQIVVGALAVHRVATLATCQHVVAVPATGYRFDVARQVGAVTTNDVVAVVTEEQVAAGQAEDVVLVRAAMDDIVARAGTYQVIVRATVDDVAGITVQRGSVGSDDPVDVHSLPSMPASYVTHEKPRVYSGPSARAADRSFLSGR